MADVSDLYLAIKKMLGSKYSKVTYQTMEEDAPETVGIYLYQGQDDPMTLDGEDTFECIKVHIQVNCAQNATGIVEALSYLREFTYKIEDEQTDVPGVYFVSARHLGPRGVAIGRNGYNILVCKCDVDLKYILS